MTPSTRMALVVVGCIVCLIAAAGGVLLTFYDAKKEAQEAGAVFDGIEATGEADAAFMREYASAFKQYFREPFEVVVFLFPPKLDGLGFTTQHEKYIDIPMSAMCDSIERAGRAISDAAYCIHNHFSPIGFTTGDETAYRYLKRHGFKGQFGIYYPATDRVVWMEER